VLYEISKIFRRRDTVDEDTRALNIGMKCGFIGLVVTAFTQETFYMAPAMGNFFGFYLIVVAFVENINRESLIAGKKNENTPATAPNTVYN
jgi:hypothetical protein